jgi:hypothetical protein
MPPTAAWKRLATGPLPIRGTSRRFKSESRLLCATTLDYVMQWLPIITAALTCSSWRAAG